MYAINFSNCFLFSQHSIVYSLTAAYWKSKKQPDELATILEETNRRKLLVRRGETLSACSLDACRHSVQRTSHCIIYMYFFQSHVFMIDH
jgi:hypothetical protein